MKCLSCGSDGLREIRGEAVDGAGAILRVAGRACVHARWCEDCGALSIFGWAGDMVETTNPKSIWEKRA